MPTSPHHLLYSTALPTIVQDYVFAALREDNPVHCGNVGENFKGLYCRRWALPTVAKPPNTFQECLGVLFQNIFLYFETSLPVMKHISVYYRFVKTLADQKSKAHANLVISSLGGTSCRYQLVENSITLIYAGEERQRRVGRKGQGMVREYIKLGSRSNRAH